MSYIDIQRALHTHGFNPGPIDGIPGRLTIKAIKAFQAAHQLAVDGLVGPQTRAILFANQKPEAEQAFRIPTSMPWLESAFQLIGSREQPGLGSNEAIIGWAQNLGISDYHDDDIPWCGLFVAHCIGSQLSEESLPVYPLRARSWLNFGCSLSPQLGAVMVFWRQNPDCGKGHVGFYWAEDQDYYHILGGNQSNSVSITRVAKNRLLSARWPTSALDVDGQTRLAAANGTLISVNEA